MDRTWSGAGPLDYPNVSLDDLSEPPPPQHTDSQPSAARSKPGPSVVRGVSAAALSRAEAASDNKKKPKMNAWQDAARDRAQGRRTAGTRGPSLPTNRPRKKADATALDLLELPGLKLKLGAPAAADCFGSTHARAPRRTPEHA